MSKQGENNNKRNVLSLDSLQEKHQESFKMVENHVSLDGELLSYKMYEKFPQTLKNEYVKDLMEFSYDSTQKKDAEDLEEDMAVFALVLAIEKFTDLEIPKDNDEKILYAEILADFGIFETIILSFDEDELTDTMNQAQEVVSQQTERLAQLLKEYESETGEIDEMSALRLVEKELESEGNGE